jgi:hypothetical protein
LSIPSIVLYEEEGSRLNCIYSMILFCTNQHLLYETVQVKVSGVKRVAREEKSVNGEEFRNTKK